MAQSHGAASSQVNKDDDAQQLAQSGDASNQEFGSQAVQPKQQKRKGEDRKLFTSTASTEFPEEEQGGEQQVDLQQVGGEQVDAHQGGEQQVDLQQEGGEQVDAHQGDEQQVDLQQEGGEQVDAHQGDEQHDADPQRDGHADDGHPPLPEQAEDEQADNDVEPTPDDASEGGDAAWFPPERHAFREPQEIDDSCCPTEDSGFLWPTSETMVQVEHLFFLARNPGAAGL